MELSYIAPEMAEDFEEAARLGAETGARWVALRGKIQNKALEDLTDEDIGTAQKILDRYGLKVSGVYSSVGKCPIDEPDAVAKNRASFTRIIEVAKAFGTDKLRVFPYQRSGYVEYEAPRLDEYIDQIGREWSPLVRQAEAENVVLCFECVGSTLARRSADIRRVIDVLGDSPAVGVIWEIDVAWRDGESPSTGYPLIKGVIRDVHVKPNPELPLTGEGETYEQAFRLLRNDDYSGPVTIEHWRSTDASLKALHEIQEILSAQAGG